MGLGNALYYYNLYKQQYNHRNDEETLQLHKQIDTEGGGIVKGRVLFCNAWS